MCDINKDKIMFQPLDDVGRKINEKTIIWRIFVWLFQIFFFAVFINPYCIIFYCPSEYPNHWNTEYSSLIFHYNECNYLNNVELIV